MNGRQCTAASVGGCRAVTKVMTATSADYQLMKQLFKEWAERNQEEIFNTLKEANYLSVFQMCSTGKTAIYDVVNGCFH